MFAVRAPRRGRSRSRNIVTVVAVVVALFVMAGGYLWHRYPMGEPSRFSDLTQQFKYGSIGNDIEVGMPLAVVKVLPRAFPEYLPPLPASVSGEAAKLPRDYTAFGFIQEPGHDMPIGFSVRTRIVPRTGPNCAACHTGSWKARPDERLVVRLGMPAANLNIGAFFTFLFKSARDPRFTAEYLLPLMEHDSPPLNAVDRALYARLIIPGMKAGLVKRANMFDVFFNGTHPEFGYGRVDALNPWKLNQLAPLYPGGIPDSEAIGTVDFPAIWNQKIRQQMALNWDGDSPKVRDRNVGAAFGAGASAETIDMEGIELVSQFLLTLPAPAYPYHVDSSQLARGGRVFGQYCASCHAEGGARYGTVEPLDSVRTDPNRLHIYTERFNQQLLDYGKGYAWKITSMRKTNGYANAPLDGIWARAPYLHNGSVPTLWDLLTPEAQAERWQAHVLARHRTL
ncbi:MAG: cytochrome c [Gemmatimonadaceae bacterium]